MNVQKMFANLMIRYAICREEKTFLKCFFVENLQKKPLIANQKSEKKEKSPLQTGYTLCSL